MVRLPGGAGGTMPLRILVRSGSGRPGITGRGGKRPLSWRAVRPGLAVVKGARRVRSAAGVLE